MFKKLVFSGFATILPVMLGAIALPAFSQTPSFIAQAQTTNITDEELGKFAKIILEQAKLAKATQIERLDVLQEEGLTEEKFQEISKQQSNANGQGSSNISAEDMKKFEKVSPQIQEITETYKMKMREIVQVEGFTVQRFNEIAIEVEGNTTLQKKVTRLLGLPE